MAHVITVGNQKGGVGKTTTAGMLAYMLSKNHRVLCVDFDMQCNLTQMMYPGGNTTTGIMDALENGIVYDRNKFWCRQYRPRDLNIIPGSDELAMFIAASPEDYLRLKKMLEPVQNEYDFIIIDTPPSLGPHLLSALMASDSAILMAMTHPFAVDAAVRFTNRLTQIQEYNPSLQLLGVAIALFEKTSFNLNVANQIRQAYGPLVFSTTLHKRAAVMKMSMYGINEKSAANRKALEQYQALSQEVIERAK